MERGGVADFASGGEFIKFLDKLDFGSDVGEHFLADEHFVEDEPGTPDIALLVVVLVVEDFGCGVEGSAGAFGHHDVDISGESEVSDFELLVLIEEDVVGLEVTVDFVWG